MINQPQKRPLPRAASSKSSELHSRPSVGTTANGRTQDARSTEHVLTHVRPGRGNAPDSSPAGVEANWHPSRSENTSCANSTIADALRTSTLQQSSALSLLNICCNRRLSVDDIGSYCAAKSVHAGALVRAMRRRFRGKEYNGVWWWLNGVSWLQATCNNLEGRVLSRYIFCADTLWRSPIAEIYDFCFLDFVH